MQDEIKLGAKVSLKEKICYGAGDFFGSGNSSIMSVILLGFFTKILGIGAGVAATIILIAKGWDAISDPLMGVISDNTRSRFGRRRPYIFGGGILIYVGMGMLFAPIGAWPALLKAVFAGFSYVLYCTISTISQVPYASLSSEISTDHKERTSANTVKLLFSMAGAALCYLIPSLIFEAYLKGQINGIVFWAIMFLGFGSAFAASMVCTAVFSKERVPYADNPKESFSFRSYKTPFTVKSFRYHITMYLAAFMCTDIVAALVVYYTQDVMRGVMLFGSPLSMTFIVAPMMVMAGLCTPLIYFLMHKKGKAFAYRVGLPFYLGGAVALASLPASSPGILVVICAVVMGLGFGGAQMLPWIIFADTIDVAELKLGTRPTGSFSGMMTFIRKMSSAFAIFVVGWVLELSGYIPGTETFKPVQSGAVLVTVRVLIGGSVAILISLAFWVSTKYKVTAKKLDRINAILEVQRTGEPMSEEMAEEREALIKELA